MMRPPPERMQHLPLLALLLLCHAVSEQAAADQPAISNTMYLSHNLEHAQTPLKTYEGVSRIQCATLCRRTTGCIKYSRDPNTSVCQLWPLPTADNPLTAVKEPLYQTILPEGFELSDDPTIAYQVSPPSSGNIASSTCRALDPDSFPAVPRTEEQMTSLKGLGKDRLIGVWDEETEGQFTDMTTNQDVELPASWWSNKQVGYNNSADRSCVTISRFNANGGFTKGLKVVSCADTHVVICEYHPQVSGRLPSE